MDNTSFGSFDVIFSLIWPQICFIFAPVELIDWLHTRQVLILVIKSGTVSLHPQIELKETQMSKTE